MAATNDPEHLPAGWTLHLKVQKTGRKIRYYKNLVTGKRFFYKDDLLQYVGMESTQGNKPQPTNSPSKRRSEYSGTKHMPKENECSEWLPDGWVMELKTRKSGSSIGRPYKVFIDPLTGCKFLSKAGVLRHLESVKQQKHASKLEKTSTGTRSSSKAAVRSTVNDLPPGWIKETRTRKTACGIKNDPYYTDPVSGIIFRSKKDVLRYLETGEISRYAFKLAKSGIDDKTLTSTAAKGQKLKQTVTSRQPSEGKASLNECSSALPEAEAFKKRRSKRLSTEIDLNGAPTAEVFPEKMVIQKGTGTKEITSLGCSSLPKSTGSKRYQGKKILADSLPVPTTTNCLQGQNLLERGMECSSRKSLNNSSISKNKKKLNLPRRSSKRLAGHEPELVVNWDSTTCSPKIATTKSRKSEAIPAGGLTSDGLSDKASEQLKVGIVKEHTNCMSFEQNLQSHGEASKNLVIPGEQPQKFDSAKTDDVDVPRDKILQENEIGKSRNKKTRINSIKSKNKQELNLPRRSSKRLSGLEPELVSNLMFNDQSCGNVTRNSSRCEATTGLTDGVSQQLGDLHETTGVEHHDSTGIKCQSHGESSNKNQRDLEAQAVFAGVAHHDSTGIKCQSHGESSNKNQRDLEAQIVFAGVAHHDYTGIKCLSHGESSNKNQRDLEAQTVFAGVAHHDYTGIKCLSHGESSNKNQRDLEAQTVFEGEPQKLENENMDTGKPEDQPQNLETEKMNNENAESQFFPFGNSWPDPCLEFAYKTLTGAIPVEDNLTFQDYIQNQHVQIDGASGLSDLSMPSYFESDILFQFDAQEKPPASQQQFSVNQSLLPSGSASSPRCSSIASQQPCLEGNKGFHGKVKS
ncbi:hypothetical protein Dsin_004528 [Dipteronia sinensis]|uniref:MBD domain-containing protein n=1 Tax=Dipteronia sinensis TaxID=43782 RepID=A0AAE0AUR1_9ROSI|nr:hypothetical protein Dsin_004528 [Dipteronia sinensis]